MSAQQKSDKAGQFIADKKEARLSALLLFKKLLERNCEGKKTTLKKSEKKEALLLLAKEGVSRETFLLFGHILGLSDRRGRKPEFDRQIFASQFFIKKGFLPNPENSEDRGLIAECGRDIEQNLKQHGIASNTEHPDRLVSKLLKDDVFRDEVEHFIKVKNQTPSQHIPLHEIFAYYSELKPTIDDFLKTNTNK